MKIFVTGGAGYIGSHATVALIESGHDVIVYDNFRNSSRTAMERINVLAGREVELIEGDLLDAYRLTSAIESTRPDAVMHFAGLKAVGESNEIPLEYYSNNVVGTLNLLSSMAESGVRSLVFSSSATVYRPDNPVPLTEDMPLGAGNPYGRTKQHIEDILRDLGASDSRWSIALLRYFNPVGAHSSGVIGEDPVGVPNNLLPFVAQVAIGRRSKVSVFGDDYDTTDGTGVRDYIHVVDLAEGHVAALEYLTEHQGVHTWNLGTGRGTSVLEIIEEFGRAAGRPIPYEIVSRRSGDAAASFADVSAARRDLAWEARRSLADMCEDHWRWQSNNPDGYRSAT